MLLRALEKGQGDKTKQPTRNISDGTIQMETGRGGVEGDKSGQADDLGIYPQCS